MSTLLQRLESSVNAHPDSVALIHRERRYTYEQLWSEVGALAAFLHEHGLEPGDRVALLLENRPEYAAAYYGVLAAGGVVVGLNTQSKARELARLLDHCGARWLIADTRNPELSQLLYPSDSLLRLISIGHPTTDPPVPVAASWQEIIDSFPTRLYSGVREPGELAAIIYTSGTTGHPKGVMLSHRNLDANIGAILQYLELGPGDRVMCVLPFYYTYGNSVLHTHLSVGGSLVLENTMAFPNLILEAMQGEAVTGFSGVPSTFALLLGRTHLEDYDLSALRYMTQAGGPMPPALISRVRKQLPRVSFFVMYGQTEGTARLTYLPPERLEEKLGSVGIGIPGVEVRIVDEKGSPVARGVSGEICIRGDNVMLGYWRDPEATARTVVGGWLHTGDLGHMDEQGYVYIDGRSSEMIKSGANRISPKEIEEVISELEEVMEVGVVGIPDDLLGQVIKAVIVVRPGHSLEPRRVMAYCRANLAAYKVPKVIEFAEELPKTASGKVQRFLLAGERA